MDGDNFTNNNLLMQHGLHFREEKCLLIHKSKITIHDHDMLLLAFARQCIEHFHLLFKLRSIPRWAGISKKKKICLLGRCLGNDDDFHPDTLYNVHQSLQSSESFWAIRGISERIAPYTHKCWHSHYRKSLDKNHCEWNFDFEWKFPEERKGQT